jgi:molybdenum transport protein
MVDAVHEVAPACEVLTTRKSMPGCKDLLVLATMAGGAWPHRLGLSETVLVFDHHMTFAGGFDELTARVGELKRKCIEKKFFAEADAEHAKLLVEAGVDGIQLDKVPVAGLAGVVRELKAIDPAVTVIAAGGIKPDNARAYAATGVDGLATTCLFTAPPLDMSVRMERG